MIGRLYCGALLADRNRVDEVIGVLREHPKQLDAEYLWSGLAVIVAIVLTFWLLSRLLARQENPPPCNSTSKLFFSLCRAHGLSWSQRWLLWRVARQQKLRDAARLFLEPERLAERHLGRRLKHRRQDLAALRRCLFAGLDEIEPGGQGTPTAPTEVKGPSFPLAANPGLDLPPWSGTAQ
jgi:hypothetical protein